MLVFKADRLLWLSALCWRVKKNKKLGLTCRSNDLAGRARAARATKAKSALSHTFTFALRVGVKFRVWGLGCRVSGVGCGRAGEFWGFGVWGLGYRVSGEGKG